MHTSTRGQRRCDGVAAALHLARNLSLVCGLLDSGGEAGGVFLYGKSAGRNGRIVSDENEREEKKKNR